MKLVPTLTWYLEMTAPPLSSEILLPEGFHVSRFNVDSTQAGATVHSLFLQKYVEMYRAVGGNYNWCDRLLMPEDSLGAILNDSHTEIFVLKWRDETAGFVEYHTIENETEIVYFGLTPEFTGKKAGLPFLEWVIQYAWQKEINRLWLHTCDLDHPAALPLYQKAGFIVYKSEIVMQPVLA